MILAIDQLLIWAVECQREDYLRKLEGHLKDTHRVDQLDRIAEARGITMICSDHADRGEGVLAGGSSPEARILSREAERHTKRQCRGQSVKIPTLKEPLLQQN